MGQRITIKLKELGEMTGDFLKTTQNSIWIQRVALGRASATFLDLVKVSRSVVLSVARVDKPCLESFSDQQLACISNMAGSPHSESAARILKERSKKPKLSKPTEKKKAADDWDQLEENAKLFGIEPTFNIDEYATPIDKSDKNYKERAEASERIAKEIMKEKTDDPHKMEERGISKEERGSDTILYSTVGNNKWGETKNTTKQEKTTPQPKPAQKQAAKQNVQPKPVKPTEVKNHEAVINEAIKDYHFKVQNAIDEGDNGTMWANVTSMLSARKQAEAKLKEMLKEKEKDAEPIEAVAEVPKPGETPQPGELVQGSQPEKTVKEPERSFKRGKQGFKGKRGSENYRGNDGYRGSDVYRHDGYRSNDSYRNDGHRSSREASEESKSSSKSVTSHEQRRENEVERKSPRQIILGRKLRFDKISVAVDAIKSNLALKNDSPVSEKWGDGPTVDERSSKYARKTDFQLPHEERIREIRKHSSSRCYYRKQ